MRSLHRHRLRAVIPLVALLLAGCGGPRSVEPGGDQPRPPSLATPEATLEAARAAAAKHDYAALCQLFTPGAQEDLAAGLVVVSRMVLASKADKEGAGPLRAKLREVLDKHGLSENNMPRIRIDAKATEEEQAREFRKLAAPIKDRCAFAVDVLGVLYRHGDKPGGRLIEESARLKDVKVEGDKATATFVQARGGRESGGPVAFEKVGGEWKISKVPPLMN